MLMFSFRASEGTQSRTIPSWTSGVCVTNFEGEAETNAPGHRMFPSGYREASFRLVP